MEEELHTSAHIDYDRVAIVANPSVSALYEDALVYENGTAITSTGAMTAYSGTKTGRSPLDKRIVKEGTSDKDVWWGPVNKEMSPEVSLDLSSYLPSTPFLSFPESEISERTCLGFIVGLKPGRMALVVGTFEIFPASRLLPCLQHKSQLHADITLSRVPRL